MTLNNHFTFKNIYIVSIAICLLCILCFGPIEYNDTPSYLNAWEKLSHGELDTFRTPLYPCFLGICQLLFGKIWMWAAIVIQYALFLLSITYFYKIAEMLLKEKGALIITAFYAIYPTFNSWGNLLLTDSIGLSLCVFFIFACFKIIMEGSLRHALLMSLMLLLLLALRPSSVSLLIPAALSFLLIIFQRRTRLSGITSLAGVILCSIALLGYSYRVQEKTGVFTPSIVSVTNDFTIARMYGYLLPDAIDDPHKSEVLKENYSKYGQELAEGPIFYEVFGELGKEFSVEDMKRAVDNSIKKKPVLWLTGLIKRAYFASLMPATTSYTSDLFKIHPLFPINIGIVILALLVYSVLIVIHIIKGDFPYAGFFLVITSLCVIGVSIVGAQYEYNRLILPAMPCVLIIISQLIQLLYESKSQY